MLDIQTFDALRGGNVLYKALVHPLAAEAIATLATELAQAGPLAVFDPDGVATALFALHPEMPAPAAFYVQDVARLGTTLAGIQAQPVTELASTTAATLLITAFDAGRTTARIAALAPPNSPKPSSPTAAPISTASTSPPTTPSSATATGSPPASPAPITGPATAPRTSPSGSASSTKTAASSPSGNRHSPPAPAASPSTARTSAPASACPISPASSSSTPSTCPATTS